MINFDEAKEVLPLESIGFESMDNSSAVTRATDIKADPGLPLFIVTGNDLTSKWRPGSGRGNAGQELFARLFVEIVHHLYAGEIDLESIYPKVFTTVKKTIV